MRFPNLADQVNGSSSARRVWLLDALRVEGQQGTIGITSSKARSLFAFLVLHPATPHLREVLADRLWPEAPPDRVLRNLSDTPYRLRQALGPGWIDADGNQVALRVGADLWVDTWEFERLSAANDPLSLQQAVALYTGELLPEVYDDWILAWRVALHEKYLACLLQLGRIAERHDQPEMALEHYRRLSHADPLREEAHRGVMRNLARMGRYAQALETYGWLETLLQEELNASPSTESRALVETLRREWELTRDMHARQRTPFVGRVVERARLLDLLNQAYAGKGSLAVLLGEAGIGKTRLLEELTQAASWRGWQVTWGQGEEFALPPPYTPLQQALRGALPQPRIQQLSRLVATTWLSIAASIVPTITTVLDLRERSPLPTGPSRLPMALRQLLQGLQEIAPHLFILDDILFARALFGHAYLQSTGEPLAAVVEPGAPVDFPWEIHNSSAYTVTQVTAWDDYYLAGIGASWRWALEQPEPINATTVIDLDQPLPSGNSRVETVSFLAPSRAGIFRAGFFPGWREMSSDYEIFYQDADRSVIRWWGNGALYGPFYQVQSASFDPLRPTFRLWSDRDSYRFGETATLTATIRNNDSIPRTFTLIPIENLDAPPIAVTVNPGQTATQTYQRVAFDHIQIRLGLWENSARISRLATILELEPPQVSLEGVPQGIIAGRDVTATITARVADAGLGGVGTPITVEVKHQGNPVSLSTMSLVSATGYLSATETILLPAADPDTAYDTSISLPNGVAGRSQRTLVLPPGSIVGADLTVPPEIGATTPNALQAQMRGASEAGTATVRVLAKQGDTVLAVSPATVVPLTTDPQSVDLAVTLPPTLSIALSYNLVVSATSKPAAGGIGYTRLYTHFLPLADPGVSASAAQVSMRDPLTLTLTHLPSYTMLPSSTTYSVTLVHQSGSFSQTQVLTPIVAGGAPRLVLTIPDDPQMLAGPYQVHVASPVLAGWIATADLNLRPHHLAYSAPRQVDAGALLPWTVANDGGVDTSISGTLRLVDRSSIVAAETAVSLTLPVSANETVNLVLPGQLRDGGYLLSWVGQDHLDDTVSMGQGVQVSGVTAALESWTERPAYLTSDTITTTSEVTASGDIAGTQLRLRVLVDAEPGSGPAVWWANELSDSGRSNHADNEIPGPLVSAAFIETGWYVPPVAVDAQIFVVESMPPAFAAEGTAPEATCDSHCIAAYDSTTGAQNWQTELGWVNPDALAANSQLAFVIHDSALAAFDLATGGQQWTVAHTGTFTDLLANETAVAVYDDSTSSYLLFDPSTGTQRSTLPADQSPALLVEDRLYLQNGGSLIAYDAITAVQVWSTPLATDMDLVAANADFVLGADSNDPFFEATLYVHDAASGALLHTVDLFLLLWHPDGNYPLQAVLDDDTFFYLVMGFSDGGAAFAVLSIDLNTGLESTLHYEEGLSSVDFSFGGSGNLLHVTDPNGQHWHTLHMAGGVQSAQNLSSVLFDVSSLAISDRSVLAFNSQSGFVYSLETDSVVPESMAQARNAQTAAAIERVVLREEWLPVDSSGTYTLPLTNPHLADDARARGQLYLEGTLFGPVPTGVAPVERQVLADDLYPFIIFDANTQVALAAEREAYRTNRPNYSQDDTTATVVLHGAIQNTSPLTSTIALTVTRNDGLILHSETFMAVPPGNIHSFTVGDDTPPTGVVSYTAQSSLGDTAATDVVVSLVNPNATVTVEPEEIILGQSSRLEVEVNNPGALPAFVTVDLGTGAQDQVLAGGESVLLTRVVTPLVEGTILYPIQFSGDIDQTVVPTVDVRQETANALLSLTIGGGAQTLAGPRAPITVVQHDDLALSLTLVNTQTFSFDVNLDYAVTGPANRNGSAFHNLSPGPTVITVPLGAIPVGLYAAVFTVTNATTGALIDAPVLEFEIVAPQWFIGLDVGEPETGMDGIARFPIAVSSAAASDGDWSGNLYLSGALMAEHTMSLSPGDTATYTGTLDTLLYTGPQSVQVDLFAADGTFVASDTVSIDTSPRFAPSLSLVGIDAGEGVPGGTVTITATVDNDGPAGEALLTLILFDETYQQYHTAPANGQSQATFVVPVPAGLIAGEFPAQLSLEAQTLRADVHINGPDVILHQALDAPAYLPFSNATWTVELEGINAPGDYEARMRYRGQEYTQTVFVDVGQVVAVPWTFEVGPDSERATVNVTNVPIDAGNARYALVIDTQWVPVVNTATPWLETDKTRYQAGETVQLTYHIPTPTYSAFVLGPGPQPDTSGDLLWTSLSIAEPTTHTYTVVDVSGADPVTYTVELTGTFAAQGEYAFAYTLSDTLPTGRYHFTYYFDSEEQVHSIDVFGITLLVENMAVTAPGRTLDPVSPLTVTADIRVNEPLANVIIRAYAVAPDGAALELGDAAVLNTSLPAGKTPVLLNGLLETSQPGTHMIALEVRDADTLALLGGEVRSVQVGGATLADLSTDRGLYTPGEPGTGTVALYSQDVAVLVVTTSDGTPLVQQAVPLAGHQNIDFAIPTTIEMDEVLIATLADSKGLTSTLQTAYKVAASLDITPPEVAVTAPVHGAVIPYDGTTPSIIVSGVFTEDVAIDAVLIDGQEATLDGNTWSVTLPLDTGLNMVQAVALDAAGNQGLAPLHSFNGEPQYGITITVTPTNTVVGEEITYTAFITSTGPLTASVLYLVVGADVIPIAGSATTGTLALDGVPIGWQGVVQPDAPVTIEWTGLTTEGITQTVFALVQGPQMLPRFSNKVGVDILLDQPIDGLTAINDSPTVVGQATTLTATVSSGTNVSYTWNLGDLSPPVTGQMVTHTYPATEVYTATVTASNTVSLVVASTIVTVTNGVPVADAGPDQTATVGTTVTLDGSGSFDPDGHTLTFGWTQAGGESVALSDTTAVSPTFTAPGTTGVLTFTLIVTDSFGLPSTPDTTVVTVTADGNLPPVADAGLDRSVLASATVTLDGSGSFDPEGHDLTFGWAQAGGEPVTLSNTTAVSPTFTAPGTAGVLTFTLIVTDNLGLTSAPDPVVITVIAEENLPPVADAGLDQSVLAGATVTLDGGGSTDPDGHLPLSYSWSQLGGTPVSLSASNIVSPTFTAPQTTGVLTFALTVTDSLESADPTPDLVAITVTVETARYTVYLPFVSK